MKNNITDKEVLLQEIITNLEYNFYPDEYGFEILTRIRYTGTKSIPAAYLCSFDGKKIFKITCEEVDTDSLPKSESDNLAEYKNNLEE